MVHRTIGVTFDREFFRPSGFPDEGEARCRVVRSACEIVSFCDDLLSFNALLVIRISVRKDGGRCHLEREVVVPGCCWAEGDWVDCKIVGLSCKCRLGRRGLRCAGVVEVKIGGNHPEWWFESEHSRRRSGTSTHRRRRRKRT